MKQWLTILMMVWAAAMLQTAGERYTSCCRTELHAAVLTPQDDHRIATDDPPLLATSTAARQLAGAGQVPEKNIRYPDTVSSAILHTSIVSAHAHVHAPAKTGHHSCPPNLRSGERYIYFLRRIII